MTKNEMIDWAVSEMCDNYCRYPQIFKEGSFSLEKLCEKCPLNEIEKLKEENDG